MPFKGNIKVSEDLSEITYYCDNGYVVRFGNTEYRSVRRKCLKHGQWEGYNTPICMSKFWFLCNHVITRRKKCEMKWFDLIVKSKWFWFDDFLFEEIKCGFPGYFPRGHIYGKSYLFEDEIYYSCNEGYELRGNPHRICNSDGKWIGLPPICIGNNRTWIILFCSIWPKCN